MYVEIYGKPACPHCKAAKISCESNNISHDYLDITDDKLKDQLFERLDAPPRSVPQIFVDGQYVGGFQEFRKRL